MNCSIRRTLITGLVVATPLLVTFWVVSFVFKQIGLIVTPIIEYLLNIFGLGYHHMLPAWVELWLVPIINISLALLCIYVLGLVAGNVLGRQFLRLVEQLFMHVPFIRGIYATTRQLIDTFSGRTSQTFNSVVLVEYPRQGIWTLAFVTGAPHNGNEIQARTATDFVSVFVPTTPNPTSGFLLFVRAREMIPMSMSVDEAFKMIISGGIVSPPYHESGNSTDNLANDLKGSKLDGMDTPTSTVPLTAATPEKVVVPHEDIR